MTIVEETIDVLGKWWRVLGVILALWIIYSVLSLGRRPKNAPPGPPTLPLIGNIHQLPKRDTHLAYVRWKERYGPIFSLQLGQETVVVLASGEMIKKLVDKRSANYADRPKLYMQDIWEHSRIIMRGYDDLWKVERKIYHQFLNVNVARKYEPYQSLETKKLCYDLLNDPEHYTDHIGRTTASIACSMSYGTRIVTPNSENLKELFRNAHGFFGMVYKSQLLDWYPSLRKFVRYLPSSLYPLKKRATAIYHAERLHFGRLFKEAAGRGSGKDALPSFASDIARAQETWKDEASLRLLTDKAASYVAGIAFEGGSDTSRNTIIGFIKAMVLYPDIQKKAQEEIDRVVGDKSLPNLEHFNQLPYVRGVLKESLRWMPTAIAGAIPHAARAQDEFEGYTIPANATIVLAVWACNNDPVLFENPRNFDPERHDPNLTELEAALAPDSSDRDHWTFGAGRRICPGMHVAEKTLFLAISRILWAFRLERAKDGNGNPVPIERDAVTQSIAACPLPFQCKMVPRSPERARFVEQAWTEAQQVLDEGGNYKQSIIE